MDCFRISIPENLRRYQSNFDVNDIYQQSQNDCGDALSRIKIFKNAKSEIEYIAYYSEDNELIKKVYYSGSNIVQKDKYRNNILTVTEKYEGGHIISRENYNKNGEKKSEVAYEYNKKYYIVSITKSNNVRQCQVMYGYDELGRVNSRKIIVNGTILQEQKFRFDILDRIVEYKDNNQRVLVEKSDSECGLISYKITDKIGNDIYINNSFNDKKYNNTRITLNGHSTTVSDPGYTDNIMLKKPYTTEDDVDLIMTSLINTIDVVTSRTSDTDTVSDIIGLKLKTNILPISMRKRVLYNIAIKT